MQPHRVDPGLSNGTMTAIASSGVAEGAEVVTGTADSTQQAAAPTTSPLLPARRGGGPGARGNR
jgi:hypothetical protein